MKRTARMLAFRGKDFRTVADVNAGQEALFADLMDGNLTLAESREIQKAFNARIKMIGSALKFGEIQALQEASEEMDELTEWLASALRKG